MNLKDSAWWYEFKADVITAFLWSIGIATISASIVEYEPISTIFAFMTKVFAGSFLAILAFLIIVAAHRRKRLRRDALRNLT